MNHRLRAFFCYAITMKQRFVFIHGNETSHWSFAWAKWLKTELEALGHQTFFETMPDSINTRAKYWLPFMQDHIKIGRDDVIIGWSSGGTAALRYAENHTIHSTILVSPNYTDLDGDELEVQSGFYDEPWSWESIKANQKAIALFTGGRDPYIPQEEFDDIARFTNAIRVQVADGDHFNTQQTFPELLEYIRSNY